MFKENYKKQVNLLLSVLPEVAKEDCFALHGGTAINLFIRNMPRLSVDIDLTYIPIEDRATSLKNISDSLIRIKSNIESIIPRALVKHVSEKSKLYFALDGVQVKLEVNTVGRGVINPPKQIILCDKAQNEFDAFCTMKIVSMGQLYGGKICAALDRQHPRDLFDVKYLLDKEGITDEIKIGFLFYLISSDRPIHEIIKPNFQDQRLSMKNNFEGMAIETFSYQDFEATRKKLIKEINNSMTEQDKQFLLSFNDASPNWGIYNFENYPSVKWKLKNLKQLKETNFSKHKEQHKALMEKLEEKK